MAGSANSFEILDHPADMGLRVRGETLSQLFAQSALALTSVLVDPKSVKASERQEVTLENNDRESLLYDWLSEILFLFDGEKMLFSDFQCQVEALADGKVGLRADISGEHFNGQSHQVQTYVKAITFHQLEIKENSDGYLATVYLDI